MPEVKRRRDEPIERTIRRLRKKMDKEETMDEFKAHEEYVKPCEKRRRAKGLIR